MTGKIIIIITIIIIVVRLLFSPRFKHYKTQLPLQYIFFFHCGSFFAPWRVKRLRSFPATRPRRILCSLCCSSPLARRLSCASPLIVLLKKNKIKKSLPRKPPTSPASGRLGPNQTPPRTHRRAHTLVFCTDVSTSSSLPFAALFPLFFNTHSIIYQRFFQDIRYAARIGFCPVVLASHCFPTLYKRCLRDCVFFCFSFAKYTTLCSVVDVTKWEKADGSKTKHHFLTRLFRVKAFFSSFFF